MPEHTDDLLRQILELLQQIKALLDHLKVY
jgi:hypothetical protein